MRNLATSLAWPEVTSALVRPVGDVEITFPNSQADQSFRWSQANGPTGGRFTSAILAWPYWAAHLSVSKNRRCLAQSRRFSGKVQVDTKGSVFHKGSRVSPFSR